MRNLVEVFLLMPVSIRAVTFIVVLFLVWCILAKPILKIISILLWIFKKLFFSIYVLLEIPVSILHSKFGSIFEEIDQGLTTGTKKVYDFTDKWFRKMSRPNTLYHKQTFLICVVICLYLLLPITLGVTEKPFTFWEETYVRKEASVIQWMNKKGWLEK